MKGEIPIADVEPLRCMETRKSISDIECLIAQPPAALRVPEIGQSIGYGVEVRADAHSVPCKIVPDVSDDAEFPRIENVAETRSQTSTSEASGQENNLRARLGAGHADDPFSFTGRA